MRERPILFSGPMVRAILDGTKTQTRRVVKPQPHLEPVRLTEEKWDTGFVVTCPYGEPGDRLYVREDHYRFGHWVPVPGARTKGGRQKWAFVADESRGVVYPVPDGPPPLARLGRHHKDPETPAWHKRLGRFMPRDLSRITLDVLSVRVERLHDISERDARAEGVRLTGSTRWDGQARDAFEMLWCDINGAESWDANPWVWVVSFSRARLSP